MCKVKYGAALKNESDVQNLIIGIIFRQQSFYRKDDIFNTVTKYIQGSSMVLDKLSIKKMVQDNLDLLVRFDRIKCIDGVYSSPEIRYLLS